MADREIIEDSELARAAIMRGFLRYIEDLRARIPDFVDQNFSLRGSLKLHRHAIGLDLVRAPANIAMAVPFLALQGGEYISRAMKKDEAAAWFARQNPFMETAVGQEIQRLVHCEFLGMPTSVSNGESAAVGVPATEMTASAVPLGQQDRLAEFIFSDPYLDEHLKALISQLESEHQITELRDRLTTKIAIYTESRAAAAEIVTAFISAGIGAAAFKQLTPSALSLGPVLAGAAAQHAAVASFPLGATAGGLWYSAFPVSAPAALTVGVTGGVMVAAAGLAAFAGVVADPIQRSLGLHERRLNKLVDSIEHELMGKGPHTLALKDHYAARIMDLIDIIRLAARQVG